MAILLNAARGLNVYSGKFIDGEVDAPACEALIETGTLGQEMGMPTYLAAKLTNLVRMVKDPTLTPQHWYHVL